MRPLPRLRSLAGALALAVVASAAAPSTATACYWDKDTLSMEKKRFPGVLELLSGKFARHSQEFYKWRIEDRRAKLAAAAAASANANSAVADRLAWLDDLGVALDKTGDHDAAIATAGQAMALQANRYETHANLGTFLIHAGRYDEGLVHIKKAIEINPNAHFGREVVQQRLVEYVIEARKNRPWGLPLYIGDLRPALTIIRDLETHEAKPHEPTRPWISGRLFEPRGFAKFMKEREHSAEESIKGLLGMLKFGNHESPVLLEALGDVLLWDRQLKDGKRLAARAYLKAAEHTEDPWDGLWYRSRAVLALVGHRTLTVKKVKTAFADERKRGDRYVARIAKDEARWIEKGEDPEAKFAAKYLRGR